MALLKSRVVIGAGVKQDLIGAGAKSASEHGQSFKTAKILSGVSNSLEHSASQFLKHLRMQCLLNMHCPKS